MTPAETQIELRPSLPAGCWRARGKAIPITRGSETRTGQRHAARARAGRAERLLMINPLLTVKAAIAHKPNSLPPQAHSTKKEDIVAWRLTSLDPSRQEPSDFRLSDQAH